MTADKPLKNPRHERFSQLLFEGKTQDEAYEKAGYKPSAPNAARLTRNDKVQARLAFLQSQAAERAVVTVEDIATQLDEDRTFARNRKAPSAMVQATMGKAKVLGLIINRHIVGAKRIEDMNEFELRALLGVLEADKGERDDA